MASRVVHAFHLYTFQCIKGYTLLYPKSPDTGLFVIALKHRRQWSCLIPLITLGWSLVIAIAFPNDSLATDAHELISVNTILVIGSHPDYPAPLLSLYSHPPSCSHSLQAYLTKVNKSALLYPQFTPTTISEHKGAPIQQIWTGRIVSEQYLV